MLKPTDLAILKASEETVFVLSVDSNISAEELTGHSLPGLSGTTVLIRRPIATEASGIQHVIERYFLEELESPEEKLSRNKREYEAFKKLASGTASVEALPPVDSLSN